MKYENLFYAVGAILVIAGALMKILHLPYANPVLLISFMATIVFQTWHVSTLKKRIKELEQKS